MPGHFWPPALIFNTPERPLELKKLKHNKTKNIIKKTRDCCVARMEYQTRTGYHWDWTDLLSSQTLMDFCSVVLQWIKYGIQMWDLQIIALFSFTFYTASHFMVLFLLCFSLLFVREHVCWRNWREVFHFVWMCGGLCCCSLVKRSVCVCVCV